MEKAKKQRTGVTGGMRVRAYAVFHRAVEEGIEQGWRRAHKHSDAPGEDAIKDEILDGIMNAVSEYFEFDDEARS